VPKFPFEASLAEIEADPEPYIDSVFSCLESQFLLMPKGKGFVEYPVFEGAHEALKRASHNFRDLSADRVLPVVCEMPITLVVLRSMLGFTPPEWAHATSELAKMDLDQGFARSLDRSVRMAPLRPIEEKGLKGERLRAMVEVACKLLNEGPPSVSDGLVHRLQKADTAGGAKSLNALADLGVPYAMLLYERSLGRPFAGHRDSVSESVGDTMEVAIEEVLTKAQVSYRKTKRAERIQGFDQTPDFIVPSEFNPQVVVEAKVAEDDGTARDKVTRIQHLAELAGSGLPEGRRRFEVVACLGGRGFRVRRQDMKKVLLATQGKTFTMKTLDRLVECTRLKEYGVR
jgi:hypothetical protein